MNNYIYSCLIFIAIWNSLNAQYTGCDYRQQVLPGQQPVPIFSKGYDKNQNYVRPTACRWAADTIAGYTIYLNCIDVRLPSSPSCQSDKLLVSVTGDPLLGDASSLCGTGSFARYSRSTKMVLSLLATSSNLATGRFLCYVSAVPSCTCGRRNLMRIVGGSPTGINEFTMMAGIIEKTTNSILCGATIISDRWVVSAAHCLSTVLGPSNYNIIVGEYDYDVLNDTPYTAKYSVSAIKRHPNYVVGGGTYDIALVQTSTTIQYNLAVGPVCLPFRYIGQTFAGKSVEACGWGSTEFGGPRSTVLLKVTLGVITNQQCLQTYPLLTNNEICTYTAGKDTCQFDSGGALYYTEPSNSLLYFTGIINYGTGCASNNPSVNARVTEYLNFITTSTAGTTYCNI